jgi:hypothetical protein
MRDVVYVTVAQRHIILPLALADARSRYQCFIDFSASFYHVMRHAAFSPEILLGHSRFKSCCKDALGQLGIDQHPFEICPSLNPTFTASKSLWSPAEVEEVSDPLVVEQHFKNRKYKLAFLTCTLT